MITIMRKIDRRRPEIELGYTCHIIVLPNPEQINTGKFQTFMSLEKICLAAFLREDPTEHKEWRVFVVPANEMTEHLWELIDAYFSEPVFVEKAC